ncbi:protein MRG1 isoform X5 [Oryza sativa Japonica Group]|uniref:protein MRG1 isoform X5 n=1 Tax=Oryza sativa subsp. japonica TaxID=39947 RepID=UPI0007754E22|nr:protein MRG1 isoform X4 [Oryza sativa Japonica Group]
MGGSSNTNTNTRSGGGKDKHDETSPSFKEGERVLAYHGPLLYEAKILSSGFLKVQKSENKEDEWRYHVHYLGWSKSWDEWVTNDRLLKLTDENIRKQQELEKSQAVDKSVKSGRSAQHKPKADAKTDKEDTKIIVKGKKRKSQPGGTEEKERKSSESLFMSHFPSTLKKQLVDDWEFVTQLGKLVKLPRSPTVDDILKKYLEHRTKKDNNRTLASSEGATTTINDSYAEILKGLRCYFDKALPAMLLYKKEQQQYTEEVKGDVSPSIIYGAEHLLRLFVKLPELLASVNMEEDALNKLQQKLLDILKFLQKNQSSFFLSAYDGGSKGTDGIKTK